MCHRHLGAPFNHPQQEHTRSNIQLRLRMQSRGECTVSRRALVEGPAQVRVVSRSDWQREAVSVTSACACIALLTQDGCTALLILDDCTALHCLLGVPAGWKTIGKKPMPPSEGMCCSTLRRVHCLCSYGRKQSTLAQPPWISTLLISRAYFVGRELGRHSVCSRRQGLVLVLVPPPPPYTTDRASTSAFTTRGA